MDFLTDNIHRIGLVADSHGNLQILVNCIKILQSFNVDTIGHLGDFLDSQYSAESLDIIDLITEHSIFVVKGNNDYQVERAMSNGCADNIPKEHRKKIRNFLTPIPIKLELGNVCFTHSLPYDSIRSFYEPIDDGNIDRADQIFKGTSYKIIFCGHSHVPALFRYRNNKVTREKISRQNPTMIHREERFIFIVGSAVNGECGIFDLAQNQYQRIHF